MVLLISKFDNSEVEEGIKRIEYRYNIELPEDYKKFLLKYNGGKTPDTVFNTKKESSDIRAFHGVCNADKYYNIEENLSGNIADIYEEKIEKGYLTIAEDSFGNDICIGISEKKYGKIYFYDHEIQKFTKIYNDFKEFISKIKSEEFYMPTIEERIAGRLELGVETAPDDPLIELWIEEIERYKDFTQEEVILD